MLTRRSCAAALSSLLKVTAAVPAPPRGAGYLRRGACRLGAATQERHQVAGGYAVDGWVVREILHPELGNPKTRVGRTA